MSRRLFYRIVSTAAAVCLVLACSEKPNPAECDGYCERIVECTPEWVNKYDTGCHWKYGDDAAYDRCIVSCEITATYMEGMDDEEANACLSCVDETVGSSCSPLAAANDDCPCTFDTQTFGFDAAPDIEPLQCDSSDHYPFLGTVEEGERSREKCLSGDTTYCD